MAGTRQAGPQVAAPVDVPPGPDTPTPKPQRKRVHSTLLGKTPKTVAVKTAAAKATVATGPVIVKTAVVKTAVVKPAAVVKSPAVVKPAVVKPAVVKPPPRAPAHQRKKVPLEPSVDPSSIENTSIPAASLPGKKKSKSAPVKKPKTVLSTVARRAHSPNIPLRSPSPILQTITLAEAAAAAGIDGALEDDAAMGDTDEAMGDMGEGEPGSQADDSEEELTPEQQILQLRKQLRQRDEKLLEVTGTDVLYLSFALR